MTELRALVAALLLCTIFPVFAQSCPHYNATGNSIDSEPRALEGKLIYHDGIRKWLELKLDQPQCGHHSIQLIRIEGSYTLFEVLRGCRVRSMGPIAEALTGYYSLDLAQDVKTIEPIGACTRQPPFPGFSHTKPDSAIRTYRVDMTLDYEPGDHPIQFRVTSDGKELQPWQAYASYRLTGGFVLYGMCADSFVVDKVFGTRQASPEHFGEPRTDSDRAMFDAETPADSGIKHLHLGYTCIRQP